MFRTKLTDIEEAHQVAMLKVYISRQETAKTNRVGVRSQNPCGEILLFDPQNSYWSFYTREKYKRGLS